ncbi:MAG: family oxidoreductase [Paucimonas sp.]|nr:family oxidoreductase [Paucimonas sp.]
MANALVIGASRGLGRELVRQLLAAGWQVSATGRSDAALDELKAMGATAYRLDVTQPDQLAALAWQMDGSELDLVIYSAGVYGPRVDASQMPVAADFDQVMHANVLGAMQAIAVFAPMVEAAGGRFACISSGLGSIADVQTSEGWLYRASKAALNMAVRAAAVSYPRATLVAISPGWVQTDMGGPQATLTAEHSVAGMLDVLGRLTLGDTGSFVNYQGNLLPW